MNQRTVQDVMALDAASVRAETPYQEIVDALARRGVTALPVLDGFRRVVGIVSETDLARKPHAPVAAGVMTAPAITVQPGVTVAMAAHVLDSHDLDQLPVVDKFGHLIGIVTRAELDPVTLTVTVDQLSLRLDAPAAAAHARS